VILFAACFSNTLKIETTRKALIGGRIDHLLIYQFQIQVCFSSTSPELVFPISLSLSAEKRNIFALRDLEL